MAKPYKQYIEGYVEEYMKKRIELYENTINAGVSIITSTNKSHTLDNIVDNFLRQDHSEKELIIIINKNDISLETWLEKVQEYENITIFKLNENISLGECLNYAIEKSTHPIIAKFDDDDYYGPKYLSDTIKSFSNRRADLIVKAANFVYFVEKETLAVRTPQEENKFVSFGNGSTLVFKKDIFRKVKFRNMSLAEDVYFCKDCIENNIKIYSTNKYHHLYFRNQSKDNHTWKIDDDEFIKKYCKVVGQVKDYINYINNPRNKP